MDTRGAPEGQQRKTAWVDAAADRDQPDPFRHVGVDDAVNAFGRGHAVDGEPRGNRVHCAGGGLAVEPLPAAEETHRIEEPEHQVGVGHGGRGSAPPVAGRPRIGAGATRADVQHATRVDVGDRATARADARDVETVQGDPMTGDPPVGRDRGLALDDERHVGARTAHVEGDEIAVLDDPARVACRRHPAGRPREDPAGGEPDRIGHGREPAVRLHDQHRPRIARLGHTLGEAFEIAFEHGADVRVDHGGADPLELLDLREHLRGEGHVHPGQGAGERLGGDALVLRRAVGVQVAHRHRLDPLGGERANRRAQRCTPKRRRLAAVGPDALAHRHAQMTRDQGVRCRLAERVAVVLEPLAHLQDVAVPLGGEQAELGSLALEQRIGRDSGPVDDAICRAEQRGPLDAERVGEQAQPGEHTDRLIPRRGGGFRDRGPSAVVDGDQIGECAAHIHTDAITGLRLVHHAKTHLGEGRP